jgi:hypothetical protein
MNGGIAAGNPRADNPDTLMNRLGQISGNLESAMNYLRQMEIKYAGPHPEAVQPNEPQPPPSINSMLQLLNARSLQILTIVEEFNRVLA